MVQPGTRSVSIKGQTFKGYLQSFEELYGETLRHRLERELTGPFRNALQFGSLVSGGWYAVDWLRELHAVGTRVSGDYDACVKVVRRSTERDIEGIYSFVARFVSPEFAFRQAARVMSVYVRGPSVTTRVQKREGSVSVTGAAGFDARIWRAIVSGSEVVLESSGAKDVVCRTLSGGGNADDHLTFRATWT